MNVPAAPGALTPDTLARCSEAFRADPVARIARNAVARTDVRQVAMNRDAVAEISHTYSHTVATGKSTSQNSSGRCWMFAGLNLFRMKAAAVLGVEDFELSQNHLMFWDKFEKANYFLESILSTLDEPKGGRLVDWLVASPLQDGGQWDMFVNLVEKYGVVPKEVMPETHSSSNSATMNGTITLRLRKAAAELRAAHAAGATHDVLRGQKEAVLPAIYRMLATHLGEPPATFQWQWRDKEKLFHRDGELTPREFYERFVGIDLHQMVCLIHCPQDTKAYHRLYTVGYLGNVVGGHPVRYLNVPLPVLKDAAKGMLRDGHSVWFGCDVGKSFDRELGVMDTRLYELESVYGTSLELDKAARLDYGHSLMTHAMVLAGVDLDDDGAPRKWRVENSWGESGGDKGYMLMTDAWFDEYLYEVVVDRRHVPESVLALLDTTPDVLDPWDPMGSLAIAP